MQMSKKMESDQQENGLDSNLNSKRKKKQTDGIGTGIYSFTGHRDISKGSVLVKEWERVK